MGVFSRLLGRSQSEDEVTSNGHGDTQPQRTAELVALVVNVETTGLSPAAGAGIHWCATVTVTDGHIISQDGWALAQHEGAAVFTPAPATVPRLEAGAAAERLAAAIAAADVVVAHNAPFERSFVAALLDDAGMDIPETPWLDTMLLAKHLHPDWPSYRLATCATHLGLPTPVAHDATAEAQSTALVFLQLRAQVPDASLPDLLAVAGVGAPTPRREPSGPPPGGYRPVTDADRSFEQTVDVRPVRGGIGIFVNFDEDPVFDSSLSPQDRAALLEARVAEHHVCGELRLKDIADARHRAAHEAWSDARYGDDQAAQQAALEELVAAGCPTASEAWARSIYSGGEGARKEFHARMNVLRAFRERGFARDEDIRWVGADLRLVNDLKAGPKLLLAAWHELGPWLAGYAPCQLCRDLGRADCRDLDLAYQAASAMEYSANAGEMERVGKYLAAPDDAKPHLSGKPAEYVALMDELRTASPSGYARLACAVAEAVEKTQPELATDLYYANVRAGQAERYEFDRLSLLLERARRFDEAVEVAELGLAHPECGATRGERLRKRVERCRAKAAAPRKPVRSGAADRAPGGDTETLTCQTCGREFTRVRTRGRKPSQCPDCRA